jgi:hypothetical protein
LFIRIQLDGDFNIGVTQKTAAGSLQPILVTAAIFMYTFRNGQSQSSSLYRTWNAPPINYISPTPVWLQWTRDAGVMFLWDLSGTT